MFLILGLIAIASLASAYDFTRHNRSLVLHRHPLMYTRPKPAVTTVNTTTPVPAPLPVPRSLRRS